jgi:hypothetical protein
MVILMKQNGPTYYKFFYTLMTLVNYQIKLNYKYINMLYKLINRMNKLKKELANIATLILVF